MLAVMMVCFLLGLDLTIVALAVPSLRDQIEAAADIGWYSATYGLVTSSTRFFFAELYTLFDVRRTCVWIRNWILIVHRHVCFAFPRQTER